MINFCRNKGLKKTDFAHKNLLLVRASYSVILISLPLLNMVNQSSKLL